MTTPDRPATPADDDGVDRQREQLGRLARLGTSIGWGLFGLATVAFFIGIATGIEPWVVMVVTVSLGLATLIMVPAIILGYAVRKAIREDPTLAPPPAT